jgi:hypothetical protein
MLNSEYPNPFALVIPPGNGTSENTSRRFAGIQGGLKSAVSIDLDLLGAEIQTLKVLKTEQQSFPHQAYFLLPSPSLLPPPLA